MKCEELFNFYRKSLLIKVVVISMVMLLSSCSTTVNIASDTQMKETVDLLAIGPKNCKEFRGISFPFKYKIKDNNVPQLLLISSNSCIYDSIWIEAGSRNINENWAPPAIMLTALTFGAATPILKYMWADIPSQKYYLTRGVQVDSSNSYKLDEVYRELNLILLSYELLERNDFKKAYSITNYLIEKNPSAEIYYLRGVSNLKSKEKKKALKDFKKALEHIDGDSQSWLYNELCNNINAIENHMDAERKQKWASIGSAILSMGQVAFNTYNQYNNSSLIGSGNNIDNSLLDPKLAINQVRNHLYHEYLGFTKYNKKYDGSEYSFDEWMAIRGQAINDFSSGTSDLNGSYKSNSESGENTIKGYIPDCHLCHGSGKCNTCYGEHRYINPLTGKYIECPNCKPDGVCTACGGSGKNGNISF